MLLLGMFLWATPARAGLTMELHFYRGSDGGSYSFYTPLYTNAVGVPPPLGTYLISSPHEPTNGSVRGFQLTAGGMQDLYSADSEHFYNDFDSAIFQITNGPWTLLFTNATRTNVYHFTISASPSLNSNMLPATSGIFPVNGAAILTTDTNFFWQGPTSSPGTWFGQVFNQNGYYTEANLPGGQTNWTVDSLLPADPNYTLFLRNLYTNTLFSVTTPVDTNSAQPLDGWNSFNVLETGFNFAFGVVENHGIPSRGHTLLANYTFEDNNPFVHDFSGYENNMSYAWFSVPPTIVTNDAAAGIYAGGLGGSGWFTPGNALKSLFEKSFSVSLWLKTANVVGSDTGDLYSAPGIVSDLGNSYEDSAAPMVQTGHKLGFYTGGATQNMLRSRADITTEQYVHLVTTRDQQTGEKRIYVNGVLDASIFASTNVLTSSSNGDLTIGYNNGQVFQGQVDEVQFYSGVLSSNDVVFLHSHPGTNVADVLQIDFPVARYDFEDTNNAGADTSGRHNDTFCYGYFTSNSIPSTNSIIGAYAEQFFRDSWVCLDPSELSTVSNALTRDFTVTAWVNTTNSVNSDGASADSGMPVFSAYSEPTNGTIPIAITGSKAAFSVFNTNSTETTVHSLSSVNDGKYHFIAVTRTQANGLMSLYVDGVLEATAIGSTAPIYTDGTMYIGGYLYTGLIDDLRIYGGALSADDISALSGNGPLTFASALQTTNFLWTTDGDSKWFVETANTYNGALAALQSGSVTNDQTSTVTATISGPGLLTFAWQNAGSGDFDLEFDIDGIYQADIGSFTDWTLVGPFHIPPGQHTLSWTANAFDDVDPTEAAFLGEVSFIPSYLVAHYDFENTNVLFPIDVSNNGNDMNFGFGFNGGGTSPSNNAAAGTNSLCFFKNPANSFSGGMVGWSPSTPAGILDPLARSFTLSLWIKTTNHTGVVGDSAANGAPVISADVLNDARDLTPVALTGGAVAFGTGGTPGDDTLTSAKLVNDNLWHHVVITRDQLSGQKRIFIDGVEDASSPGLGVTGLLDAPQLLSIGSRLDASHSDPSTSPIYSAGYDGLIDDLQIYSRPLASDEVAFLYTHPGSTLTTPGEPVPYSLVMKLEIHRNQNYSPNADYYAFPSIVSSTPAPLSYHQLLSPHGSFSYRTDTGSAGSPVYNSLDSVLQECTNGLWTLILNAGNPSQETLNFSVAISNLTPSLLGPVVIYTPTNGSVNVSRTPAFQWSGPANLPTLDVIVSTPPLQNFGASLPNTATNWLTAPTLNYGTNQFFVNYTSNNVPMVTFSTPVDPVSQSVLSNWIATAMIQSSAPSTYIVGAPAPLPVHLGSIQHNSASFQFGFPTLAGRPHILQGTTNLAAGPWVDITNFVGDGSTAQFTIPNTNLLRYFRIVTQ
jgi:hypothetical protein